MILVLILLGQSEPKKWKYIKNFSPLDVLFEIPDDVIESPSAEAWLREHP